MFRDKKEAKLNCTFHELCDFGGVNVVCRVFVHPSICPSVHPYIHLYIYISAQLSRSSEKSGVYMLYMVRRGG